MSGATAAHASYNGSGTQGLAVTNKINDTGDIMSVFWTKDKTTKQLLHGCALIEIPSSGGTSDIPGSSITFTMNSDMDVIGDLYVHVKITMGAATNITKEYGLLNLFERVEFQCGTQIWQTLEFADILALNTTELSEGGYERFILSTGGFFDASGGAVAAAASGPTNTDLAFDISESRNFSFKLPLLTRNLGPMLNNYSNISESGFLTAAAPNQTVKIKIFTNKTSVMSANTMIDATNGSDRMEVRLFGKHMIMCNEEREKIRSIPGGIAKRLKLTQYRDAINPPVPTSGAVTSLELDCDHFSLYASHIIIQIFDDTTYAVGASTDVYKLGGASTDYMDECSTLISADLKLNSTSFCGTLTGGMMSGPLPESMGLYVNNFFSRTDPHTRTILYVFPLANKAYSGSGVPLNRFDNIRLSLKIFTPEKVAGTNTLIKKVSATCVGETTALYKQGAASISMY